jgi:heme-degrading monooxygenase HmoA
MHDAVSPEDQSRWTRRLAVESNNRAWRLAEAPSRTGAEDEEMLHCAHAAALHWSKVGTELHNARAIMLLGHVEALLGDGHSALPHAREAFDFVTSRDSAAWEVAFAHAVLANAAAAAGERELHAKHYEIAGTLGKDLADAEERAIFEATYRVIPRTATILEAAPLQVRPGQSQAFEAAFRQAQAIISSMPGYRFHELQRCIEREGHYLLLVRWDSVAAHEEGFRQSPRYQEWKRLLHHFYDPFPAVLHFERVAGTGRDAGR